MKKVVAALTLVVAIPFGAYGALTARSFVQGADLSEHDGSIKTEYIFRFGQEREVYINDEFSQISRSWGGSPDSIETRNGTHTIIFTEPAILKTNKDSIEPQSTYVKLKGYMGIITNDTRFSVDVRGVVSSSNWHGG